MPEVMLEEKHGQIVAALRKEIIGGKYQSPDASFPSERATLLFGDISSTVPLSLSP